jgi:PAT family beta-lactamase induction signal transducer AmpG
MTQAFETVSTEAASPALEPASFPADVRPWWFVPTLYFLQGLPYFLVSELFAVVYKNLGIDNLQITLWTGLAVLPWTFKMFWAPLVELNATRRRWTVAMEVLLTIVLAMSAMAMTSNAFFGLTVAAMFVIATLSATHDIACDGLYLLSLDRRSQAAFSGVLSLFSRLARLFVTSAVVFLAGYFQKRDMTLKNAWALALGSIAIAYAGGMLWNSIALPRPAKDVPPDDVAPGERRRNVVRVLTIVAFGIAAYYLIAGSLSLLGNQIYHHAPAGRIPEKWNLAVADLHQQYMRVAAGLVALPVIWMLITKQVRGTVMGDAFVSYIRQPGFGAILTFIIFYRFGESMIFAMNKLFFLDTRAKGGMEISLQTLGAVKGMGEVFGLILGGLLGGWYISRVGLRRAFWPLVVCMHLPGLFYIWLAFKQPGLIWAYPVAFIEAFGFGAGFAAYFVFLMQIAQRNRFVTTHYAMGTGLGAMFIAFATIFAGIVQSVFGYKGVFIAACLFTIPGTLTLLFIPLDKNPPTVAPATAGH